MPVFKDVNGNKVPVAELSYHPHDSLAQLIVDAWVDPDFEKLLLGPGNAKPLLADRGLFLKNPVVITEAQFEAGFTMSEPDGMIFVLPSKERLGNCPPGQNLLDTARLLMASVPNGI
jgi:hypothetical protein